MNIALITVSSDSFLPGTMVLFHSFLTHNPWFTGNLIVIDGGLSEISKASLTGKFNVIIKQPDNKIEEQLDNLITLLPAYAKTRARFYSLEMFSFNGYDQVLFLDSDMLCLHNVHDLFLAGHSFAACADHRYYQNCVRNKKTFLPVERSTETELFNEHFIDRFFNTGFMLVNGSLLNDAMFHKLINAIQPGAFKTIQTGHTDTVILNNELLSKVTWLDIKYNLYATLFDSAVVAGVEPCFVHFMGKQKPWMQRLASNKWLTRWHKVHAQMQRPKVFCVGFHKTGTTSLGSALQLLGYNNCHGAGAVRNQLGDIKMMELLFKKEYAPFFDIAHKYDSFNDNPWFKIYKELDARFPGSKFILMLRDEDEWLQSCIKYFNDTASGFRLWLYGKGSPVGNEDRYLKIYCDHNRDVMQYFNNRPNDLLIVNLADPDKLPKIKDFLNLSHAVIEFPHLNRS
jgi:lipopolysaccharide biosynthesis glycosyltransferase